MCLRGKIKDYYEAIEWLSRFGSVYMEQVVIFIVFSLYFHGDFFIFYSSPSSQINNTWL